MERKVDPLELDSQGIDGDEILSNVVLDHFVAEPDHIEPFGTSELNWAVAGPLGQFVLKVSSEVVPPVGSKPVKPATTQHYSIHASAGVSNKLLG